MPYQLFMCLFIIKFMFMNNSFFNNPYHKCLTWCQDCSSCVILLPEPPAIQTRPKKGRNLWGPTNIHIFLHASWVIKVWGKYKRWFSATFRLFLWPRNDFLKSSHLNKIIMTSNCGGDHGKLLPVVPGDDYT